MIRGSYLIATILGIVFILAACDSNTSLPESGESASCFLDHINSGCAVEPESAARNYDDAYLRGFCFEGDTLTLDIHFKANCCPEFVEKIDLLSNSISIDVVDTLYNCRCICPYNNKFRFLWENPGEVEISFRSTYWSGSTPICSFDTLIVLSQ